MPPSPPPPACATTVDTPSARAITAACIVRVLIVSPPSSALSASGGSFRSSGELHRVHAVEVVTAIEGGSRQRGLLRSDGPRRGRVEIELADEIQPAVLVHVPCLAVAAPPHAENPRRAGRETPQGHGARVDGRGVDAI